MKGKQTLVARVCFHERLSYLLSSTTKKFQGSSVTIKSRTEEKIKKTLHIIKESDLIFGYEDLQRAIEIPPLPKNHPQPSAKLHNIS